MGLKGENESPGKLTSQVHAINSHHIAGILKQRCHMLRTRDSQKLQKVFTCWLMKMTDAGVPAEKSIIHIYEATAPYTASSNRSQEGEIVVDCC